MQDSLEKLVATEPVRNEIIYSPLLEDRELFEHHSDLVRDCLYDLQSISMRQVLSEFHIDDTVSGASRRVGVEMGVLSENPIMDLFDEVPMKVVRGSSSVCCSTQLDVAPVRLGRGFNWVPSQPQKGMGMELRYLISKSRGSNSRGSGEDECRIFFFGVQSMHLQWMWVFWLKVGLDLALRGDSSEYAHGETPEFTDREAYSSPCTLKIGDMLPQEARATLSIKRAPYQLRFQKRSSSTMLVVDLESLQDMVVDDGHTAVLQHHGQEEAPYRGG